MPRKDFKNSKKIDRPVKSVKSAQKQQKQFKEFNVPVKAGAEYIVNISSLGSSGEGVGRVSDFTVFVNGALPGEEVKAKITEVKNTYAIGKLMEVVKASPERIKPACPIYAECGGCQLQHISYEG